MIEQANLLQIASPWHEKKRYKVNQVVVFDDLYYQNITGKNSNPVDSLDWIKQETTGSGGGDSKGFVYLENTSTDTTLINYTANDFLPLINNVLGTKTSYTFAPNGVTSIWNSSTNRFDFSELEIGDQIIIYLDVEITPTQNGQRFVVDFSVADGTSDISTVTIYDNSNFLNSTVKAIKPFIVHTFTNENQITGPSKLTLFSSLNASLKIKSFIIDITKASITPSTGGSIANNDPIIITATEGQEVFNIGTGKNIFYIVLGFSTIHDWDYDPDTGDVTINEPSLKPIPAGVKLFVKTV